MSELAKLADARTRPSGEGYIAERHPAMPDLMLVWAPACSCCWVIPSRGETFLTTCGSQDCSFNWAEAAQTLLALQAAETPPALSVVPPAQPAATVGPRPTEETSS